MPQHCLGLKIVCRFDLFINVYVNSLNHVFIARIISHYLWTVLFSARDKQYEDTKNEKKKKSMSSWGWLYTLRSFQPCWRQDGTPHWVLNPQWHRDYLLLNVPENKAKYLQLRIIRLISGKFMTKVKKINLIMIYSEGF